MRIHGKRALRKVGWVVAWKVARRNPLWAGIAVAGLLGVTGIRHLVRTRRARRAAAAGDALGATGGTGTVSVPSELRDLPPETAAVGITPAEGVDLEAAKNVGNDPPGWLP